MESQSGHFELLTALNTKKKKKSLEKEIEESLPGEVRIGISFRSHTPTTEL